MNITENMLLGLHDFALVHNVVLFGMFFILSLFTIKLGIKLQILQIYHNNYQVKKSNQIEPWIYSILGILFLFFFQPKNNFNHFGLFWVFLVLLPEDVLQIFPPEITNLMNGLIYTFSFFIFIAAIYALYLKIHNNQFNQINPNRYINQIGQKSKRSLLGLTIGLIFFFGLYPLNALL